MADWHYEQAGRRLGPVDAAELDRLVRAGEVTRDTLVWSPEVGSNFVRLGDTNLAPALTEPPPLPASAVDNSLAWLLVAIPLGSAVLEGLTGRQDTSIWGWPLAIFVVNIIICTFDEKRVLRSGVADRSIRLGWWVWLVPVYLYQRARALKGPKLYVWAWLASFAASLFVGVDTVPALINGDVYLGTGLPACDSSYQIGQVRKIVDNLEQVRIAGLKSTGVTNARELGTAGDVRTCAAQINLSNGSSDSVVYVIERTEDQLKTTLQAQTQ